MKNRGGNPKIKERKDTAGDRPTSKRRLSQEIADFTRKRHINIWHINNFSVAPVTDPPGRVPGRKCLCSLGSAHSTWAFDPGHAVGRPPSTLGLQETVLLVNHALARGTPAIFVIFVVSRGSSSKTLVLLVRMQIRHFRHFRQKPPFSGGTKARFTKSTVFGTPGHLVGRPPEKFVYVYVPFPFLRAQEGGQRKKGLQKSG